MQIAQAVLKLGLFGLFVLALTRCGSQETNSFEDCAPSFLPTVNTSQGSALVFLSDPITSSGDVGLSPLSSKLDDFRTSVPLSNLEGSGVLKGKYIEVVNGLDCNRSFGAYDLKQKFSYFHKDPRFQEAMSYYFGDTYQSYVQNIGYLQSLRPIKIVAHCEKNDNAYFMRDPQSKVLEEVCLGDSVYSPGSSYGDDGIVVIHELQHASTVDNYSVDHDFSRFWYDEAGALNEAISDFMGLLFTEQFIAPVFNLDPRVFSRWALGSFNPKGSRIRGAHKCPTYDSSYPNCDLYPQFAVPTSSNPDKSTLSYIYPDGVGWPYPSYFSSNAVISHTYQNYLNQEEIHNAGITPLGALWDVYAELNKNHPGNQVFIKKMLTGLILETIRHLPQPNATSDPSPVTFIKFAETFQAAAALVPTFTQQDQNSISQTLKARGLVEYSSVPPSWMSIGPGTNVKILQTSTPGVYILDDPTQLQSWLNEITWEFVPISQGEAVSLNSRLDPGETVAIWFDIQNDSEITAGGVLNTVTVDDPDVSFLNGSVNRGYVDGSEFSQARIIYQKINGRGITSALTPEGALDPVNFGNSYFKTNPNFYSNWMTALFVKVSANAPHGKVVHFNITSTPSNGDSSSASFPVTIN